MALDESFVGRKYPPTETYEVGREKIREFAEAIGDFNPVYRDPAAAQALGHPDVIAPPTMAIIVTMRASGKIIGDPELGIDYSKVVHGEQRFVHARPIHAGDTLSVQVEVEAIRQAAGNDIISTKSDVTDAAGELICTAYATIVAPGDRMISYQDVEVGTELPAQEFPIERFNLVMYAGASGDFNPIHWNEPFATSVGLPNVIAHGMFTMALTARALTDWTGDPGSVLEYGVRFSRPVPVPNDGGTKLSVSGRVAEKLDDNVVAVDLTATVGGQSVLIKAKAKIRLS